MVPTNLMMEVEKILQLHYRALVKALSLKKRLLTQIAIFRLVLFATGVGISYAFFGEAYLMPLLLLLLVVFFLVLRKQSVLESERNVLENRIFLVDRNLRALKGDFAGVNDGGNFADAKHDFSADLDLFGPGKVFSFLNRCVSTGAEEKLVEVLLNGNPKEIEHEAFVQALANNEEWMEIFLAHGRRNARQARETHLSALRHFALPAHELPKTGPLPFVTLGLGIFALLGCTAGGLSDLQVMLVFLLNLVLVGLFVKRTSFIGGRLLNAQERIQQIHEQSSLLKSLSLKPEFQAHLQHLGFDANQAMQELQAFLKVIRGFEHRNHVLIAFALNACFGYDLFLLRRLQAQAHLITRLKVMEEITETMEVYCSKAYLLYLYPTAKFAEKTDAGSMELVEAKHPLLLHKEQVANSITFEKEQQFMILTGPNMAGKSTFLRTLGIQVMLANAGFPVFAERAVLPKVRLFTSMRNADDLNEEHSYFHAEILRLKKGIEWLQHEGKVFFLLDELLKGTNSNDKLAGSRAFVQKLQREGGMGVVATHDLELCLLTEESASFVTYHFDSRIIADELHFDYTLRKGVCQNMNASFLLKKYGLT